MALTLMPFRPRCSAGKYARTNRHVCIEWADREHADHRCACGHRWAEEEGSGRAG